MLLAILSVFARSMRYLRTAVTRTIGLLSVAYYSAAQAISSISLWAGALLLVALPIAEIAIGLDVITMAALIAPGWGVLMVIVSAVVYMYRRRRRRNPAE
ncbi:hypothetical protein [Nocardia sp. NPDC056000]|uniref:hypothetical protein n=1 Tax=Nocardia sp. NPDC056000 TaxID=3345674 RepID=UPI0035DED4DE